MNSEENNNNNNNNNNIDDESVIANNNIVPTASETITNQMLNLTNKDDVNKIINLQTEILKKQYETNHVLSHFNEYSSQKYNQMSNDFEKHTKMLKEMKKDLDYIFKKTRNLQILLNDRFPGVAITDQYNEDEDEEED